MPISFAESQHEVAALVQHFRTNLNHYRSPGYKEAAARQDFIDPLFNALGWDVNNKQHLSPIYKEVIFEESREVEGSTKAPDYTFRVGREAIFFVEAKRPGIHLKLAAEPAYQVRRYAWSQKLPLSVLTDFEEFAVYEGRTRPNANDKASVARVNFYTFDEYADRWREIWDVFSREAVLAGSFQQYVESGKGRRGTSEVDAEFLKDIERWRDVLARNIALRNLKLSLDDLNDMVQRLIDRMVFLRIAEDRGIEPENALKRLTENDNLYAGLVQQFYAADRKYNSGLFDFTKSGDNLSPRLKVDDQALQQIILDLYYPRSPYQFDRIPVEILGNVYEQFLGKVIKLTDAHHAKVEEKPEVKKAGGVYYTPAYIVAYIVKQTIGAAVEGKSPKQLEKFRVLDMACGSGSFLLGAYQFLLDYYLKWYVEQLPPTQPPPVRKLHEQGEEQAAPSPATASSSRGRAGVGVKGPLHRTHTGEWALTIAERKRILTTHLFGVDIDRQAVEVTKLSLLLKVLEGEAAELLQYGLGGEFQERALPNLDANIKCGNSLIGSDYFDDQLLPDEDERRRVNPFDWAREFPQVFDPHPGPLPKKGEGERALPSPLIGRGDGGEGGGFDCIIGNPPYGATFGESEAGYFQRKYQVFRGARDVYTCFMEMGLSLMKSAGQFSFIVPSAWLGGPEYIRLRQLLLEQQVETVVLLPFDVFPDAYVDTAIIVFSKRPCEQTHQVRTHVYGKREKIGSIDLTEDRYQLIAQTEWFTSQDNKFVLDLGTVRILERLRKQTKMTFAEVVQIKRGVLFDRGLLTSKRTGSNSHRYFEGDVYRYELNLVVNQWIEFDDKMKERPKEFAWFEGSRLLLRRLVNRRQRLMATFAKDTFITNKNLYSVLPANDKVNLQVVLGVLNSRLISYLYINQVTQATKDDFPQVTIKDILGLPFPTIDHTRHDRMVTLVQRMLDLQQQVQAANSEASRQRLQREIDATDEKIDALVYELYGLTAEEIGIVEGKK